MLVVVLILLLNVFGTQEVTPSEVPRLAFFWGGGVLWCCDGRCCSCHRFWLSVLLRTLTATLPPASAPCSHHRTHPPSPAPPTLPPTRHLFHRQLRHLTRGPQFSATHPLPPARLTHPLRQHRSPSPQRPSRHHNPPSNCHMPLPIICPFEWLRPCQAHPWSSERATTQGATTSPVSTSTATTSPLSPNHPSSLPTT